MFQSIQSTFASFIGNDSTRMEPPITLGSHSYNNSSSITIGSNENKEKRSLIQYTNEFSSEDDEEEDYPPLPPASKEEGYSHHIISLVNNVGATINNNFSSVREKYWNATSMNNNTEPDTLLPMTNDSNTLSNEAISSSSSSWRNSLSSWKEATNRRLGEFLGNKETRQQQQQPRSLWENLTGELDNYTTMSKTTRMYSFFICLGVGFLFIMIAMAFLPSILLTARLFAIFYTIGNFLLILSTFFLVGPMKQLSMMMQKDRLIPSLAFIGSLFLTMFAALVLKSALLVLPLLVVQAVSLAYYIISYVPFGQRIVGVFISSIGTAIRAMF
jgi:ABC-type multidrug transport system fused ATPase/permease subunit